MRFKLIEQVLFEDLQAVRDRYPNMSDRTFNTLIAVDPTYVDGSYSVAKYTKWILDRYTKGDMLDARNGEIMYEDKNGNLLPISSLTRYLQIFDDLKSTLSNRDIGQFKHIADLLETAENLSEDDLTDRQKERRARTAFNETELVFETPNWWVYVPKSYKGSCTLGKGTRWCTAQSENDRYYNEYASEGTLYVIINKHNPKEKYQFHFETRQFMDADDEDCSAGFFVNKKELLPFFEDMIEESETWDTFESYGERYGVAPLDQWITNKVVIVTTETDYMDIPYEVSFAVMKDIDGLDHNKYLSTIYVNRDHNNYLLCYPLFNAMDTTLYLPRPTYFELNEDGSLTEVDSGDMDEDIADALEFDIVNTANFRNVSSGYILPIISLSDQLNKTLAGKVLFDKPFSIEAIGNLTIDDYYLKSILRDTNLFLTYLNDEVLPNITEADVLDKIRHNASDIKIDITEDDNNLIVEIPRAFIPTGERAIKVAVPKIKDIVNMMVAEYIENDLASGVYSPSDIGLKED